MKKALNNINYKFIFKSVGIFFVLNIIPILYLYVNMSLNNKIKDETKKIINDINKILNEQLLYEKETNLTKINYEISFYLQTLTNLENSIKELNDNNNSINKNMDNLKVQIEEQKDFNKELNSKYNSISSHYISNIKPINQYPLYPNGCEAVALTVLLKYYNVDVTVDNVIDKLAIGKVPYYKDGILYGGNPNIEFLGNPKDIKGWGIWNKGLANTAEKFKNGIIDATGTDFNDLIKIILNDRPVIVWTSFELFPPFEHFNWIYEPTGETIIWKSYNHAVLVIGYSEDLIITADSINGTVRSMNRNSFIDVYNQMGKKAIYY